MDNIFQSDRKEREVEQRAASKQTNTIIESFI